jgi:hypothetical protein
MFIHARFLIVEAPHQHWVNHMPFGIKKALQVDLGEMHEEKDKLTSFLNSKLKVDFAYGQNKLTVESETVPPEDLERAVNKFVYHQNLNRTFFVSLEGRTVKINKFKNAKKPEKKEKPGTAPTFAHGF